MIRASIVLLIAVGIGAIWGKPIADWLDHLGGSTSDNEAGADKPRSPAGGTL